MDGSMNEWTFERHQGRNGKQINRRCVCNKERRPGAEERRTRPVGRERAHALHYRHAFHMAKELKRLLGLPNIDNPHRVAQDSACHFTPGTINLRRSIS